MDHVFDQVVAAFVAKLKESVPVCANVFESETRQMNDEVQEAVHVFFDGAVPELIAIMGAPLDWKTRIVVDCFARSKTLSGAKAVGPLMKRVFERLASDITLGKRDWYIGYPSIEQDADAQGQRAGMMRLTYLVEHRTTSDILE